MGNKPTRSHYLGGNQHWLQLRNSFLPNAHIENIVVPSGIGTGTVKLEMEGYHSNIMPLLYLLISRYELGNDK
ncbi:MAG: hypothetical protein ACLRZE_05425 [Streptococcus salivarius]